MSTCVALLQSSHDLISRLRDEPHWRLNDQDAKAYGAALANATRHMSIAVAQKYVDYYTLGLMVVMMESPRILLSQKLRSQKGQTPRGPAQVFAFRPPSPPPQPPSNPGGATAPQTPIADSGPGFVADGVDAPLGGA